MEILLKNNISRVITLIGISFYVHGSLAQVPEPEIELQQEEALQPDAFIPPIGLDMVLPEYPYRSAVRGDEGWVLVNYMVDVDGNAFEATVIDSSGEYRMEDAALEAIEASSFEPAELNGTAIEGSAFMRYTFVLSDGVSASSDFARSYRRFHEALDEEDHEEAKGHLDDMEEMAHDNLYEDAFYNWAKYAFAKELGDVGLQLDSLNRALAYAGRQDEGRRFAYLSPRSISEALSALFSLQVESKYYGEAINSYRWMEESYPNLAQVYESTYKELLEIKSNNDYYSLQAEIDESLFWTIELHKSSFFINDVVGQIDELKLRCDSAFRLFPFQENEQYQISDSWGTCSLEVIGYPDTTFSLFQTSSL